jgi:hypothetical protein
MGFLWYEDPNREADILKYDNWELEQKIATPIFYTDPVRRLGPYLEFIQNEPRNFMRADPEYDRNVTDAMNIARIVEGEGLNIKFQPPCSAWRHCLPAVRNTNYSELALVHPKFTNTQPLSFQECILRPARGRREWRCVCPGLARSQR